MDNDRNFVVLINIGNSGFEKTTNSGFFVGNRRSVVRRNRDL